MRIPIPHKREPYKNKNNKNKKIFFIQRRTDYKQ